MPDAPAITTVPFIDLARQHAEQQAELEAALIAVLRDGGYCNGPAVRSFEAAMQTWVQDRAQAIACSNGTDALLLALQALGVGPATKVLTPAFSFFASSSTISLLGGTPVFADIEAAHYCVSRRTLEAAWEPGIAGLVVVHLYGHPAPMEEILSFAQEKGLWVLEDTAQGFGARYQGEPVGTFGAAGTLSFYPTKNLNACGDAGMILARDPQVADTVRLLRTHGEAPRYHHHVFGRNGRMDDFQAAILSAKLPHLERWNARRREIAAQYSAAFAGLPLRCPPGPDAVNEPIYHQYTIATERRDALKEHLIQRGIGCGIYYPLALPQQPVYVAQGASEEACPTARRLAGEVLSLPIFPQLTDGEIAAVIAGVRDFFGA